jgi:hypothetical protein
MMIADAQVHLWCDDHPEGKPRHGDRPYHLPDLLVEMRAAAVDRAVVIPPYWVGMDNSFALGAARLHPDRFAVMGRFDVTRRDDAAVAGWLAEPCMRGIRLTLHTPELKPFIAADQADWFWAAAETAGIPIMLYAPDEWAGIRRIAQEFPRLRLSIDHMGIGRGGKDEEAFAHIDELLALARLPNVAVKMTTAPIYSSEPYPHPRLQPFLRRICDVFGPRRVFWGSDLTRLPCSYRVAIDLFLQEFRWLSTADLELIMGRALCDWLDWAVPEGGV